MLIFLTSSQWAIATYCEFTAQTASSRQSKWGVDWFQVHYSFCDTEHLSYLPQSGVHSFQNKKWKTKIPRSPLLTMLKWLISQFSASYLILLAWLTSMTTCSSWTEGCFEDKSISDYQITWLSSFLAWFLYSQLSWWSWTSICVQRSLHGFSVSHPKLTINWQILWGEKQDRMSGSPRLEFRLHSEPLAPQVLSSMETWKPSAPFKL